ncbi:ABC transporter substrate-binding protein [Prosthecomicrobium hirschii]|uniref:ABC transporter substrate-binding protein n=1 Tax=Prosthecodimorpha hirschii TaxID=665126 RepID=A0A0P6VUE8_9HYPH|nr:aliphatic sulfonate ABC transporter substrate-binding protein [Prosthecomicrobium hirschii]KPL54646.1 ABC transporter substrate-binding protein [Prosthecomicrobium hirschii]
MSTTRLSRRAVAAGLLALAAIPGLAAGAARAADKPEVIRIGSTAPGHLKFVLFRNLGLLTKAFEKDGIKVEFLTFNGGAEAATAVATGAIEFIYTGNNPALRLGASGADVKAIGLSSWVPSTETIVVVRADSPIKSLADLKGRKVAYLTGTVRHSVFSKALKTVGLATSDVENLNLGIESSGPALVRGDIDAIVESRGTVQKLVDAGGAKLLYDASDKAEWAAPYIITVNGAFARNHPGLVTRLIAEDIKLAGWVDKNPEETIKRFVAETKSSEKAVRETYDKGQFWQNPEITEAAVKALKDEEAFMAEAKLIKGKVDYAKWIDRSFLETALKDIGAGN